MTLLKKVLPWMMILCLLCACSALAEEDEPDYGDLYPESLVYEGTWACGGVLLESVAEDGGFRILIRHLTGDGMDQRLVWEYSPLYTPETGTLSAVLGSKTLETLDLDGNVSSSSTEYEDGEAVFSLDADGHLLWKDQKEDAGKDLVFSKIGNFAGTYDCDRASIEILWDSDDVYSVEIHWALNAKVSSDWSFTATYNPETATLEGTGMESRTQYNAAGDVISSEVVDPEGCFATFALDADGNLTWQNSDGVADGMVFERSIF